MDKIKEFHKLIKYLSINCCSPWGDWEASVRETKPNVFTTENLFSPSTAWRDLDQYSITIDFNTQFVTWSRWYISGHNGDPYGYKDGVIAWDKFIDDNYDKALAQTKTIIKRNILLEEEKRMETERQEKIESVLNNILEKIEFRKKL